MLLHAAARTFILLLISSKMFVLSAPIPEEDTEVKIVMENKDGGSLGDGLDNLISEMLNRIIQRRLENLLQGVSSSPRKDFQLLESSEPIFSNEDINKNSAFEEGEGFLEVSVPLPVTEIPKDILTNLPGFWLIDKDGNVVQKQELSTEANADKIESSEDYEGFVTERYQIDDLFS